MTAEFSATTMLPATRLQWNKDMLGLVHRINSFYVNYFSALEGASKNYFPFFVADQRVGVIPKFFVDVLRRFPATFVVEDAADDAVVEASAETRRKAAVRLHPDLKTVADRTERVDAALREIRDSGVSGEGAAKCLAGWRDEHYVISSRYAEPALMSVERAAAPLFGVKVKGISK